MCAFDKIFVFFFNSVSRLPRAVYSQGWAVECLSSNNVQRGELNSYPRQCRTRTFFLPVQVPNKAEGLI